MKIVVLSLTALGIIAALYSCNSKKKCQAKDKTATAETISEKVEESTKEERISESVMNDIYGVVKVYDQEVKPEVGITMELQLNQGRIIGQGGCNTYGGKMTMEGDSLKISEIRATKMACQHLNYEKDFFKAMRHVNGYSFSKGTLMFSQDGNVIIEAKRMD